MIKNKTILFISLMIFSLNIFAQDVQMAGQILDEKGQPIPGVTIVVKGTPIGIKSDLDGNYALTIPAIHIPANVVFRCIGFGSQEYKIDGKLISFTMSPKLKSEIVTMGDIVVTASKKPEKILNAPASVSVLSEERIKVTPALTVIDQLKKVAAVDIMPTGLVSNNVNVRGFNGIFSGSLLYTIDNRFASVPSLKVNAFQLVPTSQSDIQRIEVVRGPASALYGPNAANGVLAIMTKSPLDMKHRAEITVSLTGGIRATGDSLLAGGPVSSDFNDRTFVSPEIRIASKITDKIGFKISGMSIDGSDFEHYDAREPKAGDKLYFGSAKDGKLFTANDSTNFARNFKIKKYATDIRIDFRPSDHTEIILSGGLSKVSNFELTGLGGAQAKNWLSWNSQLRFKYKRLFTQVFINANDAGNTYLIPQAKSQNGKWNSQYLSDLSKQVVAQVQHSSILFQEKLDFVYGADYILTIPESFGSIYGRFDSADNVTQIGVYGQAEFKLSTKFSAVYAARVDYHDRIKEVMFSPRAALVYKHDDRNTFRLTYNRAYSSPSVLNLSLDIANGQLGNGAIVRGFGNASGFQYRYNNNLPQYLDNAGAWRDLSDNAVFATNDAKTKATITKILLASGLPIPTAALPALVSVAYSGIGNYVNNSVVDFNVFNNDYNTLVAKGTDKGTAYNKAFANAKIDPTKIADKEAIKSTVTQTVEGGYKGVLGGKFSIGVDLYYSYINNFISPLTSASYAVTPDFSNPALIAKLDSNVKSLAAFNPSYPAQINALFDSKSRGGNGNGSGLDELVGLYLQQSGNNVSSPIGTLGPQNGFAGRDIILAYLNLGAVDVFGTDVHFGYNVTDNFNIDGALSHVNKDRVDFQGAANGYIGLNAPKWKTALGLEYTFGIMKGKNKNFSARANWRWYDAFPANSAVYVGTVNAVNLTDLALTWRPLPNTSTTFITLSMSNVLDTKHQFFPGTPYMGRVTMLKISHTFIRK